MSDLLKKYSLDLKNVTDVTWKSQFSHAHSVLFYKFADDSKEALTKFEERISKASFEICFINRTISHSSKNIVSIVEDDWMPLQKELCDYLFPLPKKIKSIAITGTNGKTTTVDLIRQLAIQLNTNILTIGTLGVWLNGKKVDDFGLTSPAYIDFRKYLYQFKDKFELLAVEVSSHALEQSRYYGFEFDVGAWTSFSQDHLDYHGSLEEYFKSKEKVFDIVKGNVLVCKSSEFSKKLKRKNLKLVEDNFFKGNEFLQVDYNRKNMMLALGVLEELTFDLEDIHIQKIIAPPGRFNIIKYEKGYVVIDFAHTPDAIENISKEIRTSFPEHGLITVFGCGGDRDRSKRPLMGQAAENNSDFLFVTSDNPRSENPEKIIDDIVMNLNQDKYEVVVERKMAIKKALEKMDKDVVLIAGKGHEAYIECNGVKTPYSDEETVRKVMRND